ncbi:hypothetical protein QWZ13_02295 [Reinekea marina]|nr:hypothetical protein [Reinekea marina]MDN3647738.1 hypothetical protein [Reinekea marina]
MNTFSLAVNRLAKHLKAKSICEKCDFVNCVSFCRRFAKII